MTGFTGVMKNGGKWIRTTDLRIMSSESENAINRSFVGLFHDTFFHINPEEFSFIKKPLPLRAKAF